MRGTPKNVLRFLGTPTRPLATYDGGWRATHASPLRRSSGAALFLLYSAEGGSLSVGFRRDRPQVDYLVIDRLSKRFDSHGQAACRDVSFSVGEREFVALIGPSGCGKSTLLHIAAGLSPASSGAVLFKGKAVAAPQPDMMYIFQQYNKSIFPWKSVIDNVCLGVKYRLKLPRKRSKSSAASSSGSLVSIVTPLTFPTSSPAECSSALPSPGRWRGVRKCC